MAPKNTTVEIVEFETSDGAVYQFHRPSMERVLKASYAEERRARKADEADEELNRTWDAYQAAVNMTRSELEAWADNPCSTMASLSRSPIERNVHLLKTPKAEWGPKEVGWAKRTVSFVSRMRGSAAGEPVSDECPMSKRTISLRNWAHDPGKSSKAARALDGALKRDAKLALKADEEQTVFGLVLEPNDGEDGAPLNPDSQGEIYGRDVIRTAAHQWMLNHRLFDVQHEVYLGEQQAKVVESYLAPVDFDLPMPDGSTRRVYQGTWLVVVKVFDPKLWAAIKDGSITGFSMNGFVSREKVKVRRKKSAGPADTLCLYHRDQDGAMSAAVVLHSMKGQPLDLVSVQHGEPFPFELIDGRSRVFLVDFTPRPFTELECLAEMCDACGVDLVLVDHHAKAIGELNDSPLAGKIRGLQHSAEIDGPVSPDKLEAGCDLTWRSLFPDKPKPEVVRLIGRWDVWDHEDPLVRPTAFALEAVGPDPVKYESMFPMGRSDIDETYGDMGRCILEWLKTRSTRRLSSAFPIDLGGLRCLAVNTDERGSIQFEGAEGIGGYQAAVTFAWRSGSWSVSMYALDESVDVGEVCAGYGGGGHRGAAGFECTALPFSLG